MSKQLLNEQIRFQAIAGLRPIGSLGDAYHLNEDMEEGDDTPDATTTTNATPMMSAEERSALQSMLELKSSGVKAVLDKVAAHYKNYVDEIGVTEITDLADHLMKIADHLMKFVGKTPDSNKSDTTV